MICEKCGEMNAADVTVCSQCGETLGVEPIQAYPVISAPVRRRGASRRIGILVVLLLALATGGVRAYQYYFGTPALETVIPGGSMGYAAGDARWVWDATADVRAEPAVAKGIREMESKLGFTLEKDVMPWAGDVAFAMIDAKPGAMNGAIYIEVKDQRRFYNTVQRVRSETEKRSTLPWASTAYKGIPIRRTQVTAGMPASSTISTFWLRGWIVIGIGDRTAERVIDTWQKRTPSIGDSANWSKALNHLPQEVVSWGGVDGAAARRSLATANIPMGMSGNSDAITVFATTEKADGFRVDSYSLPTTEATAKYYKEIGAKVKPVSGELYVRLPDGTIATMMMTQPGQWLDIFKQAMKESATDDSQRRMIDQGLAEMAGLESVLRRMSGDAGAAVAWQPTKGFGGVLVADMGDDSSALQGANELTAFAEKHNTQVTMTGNGTRFTLRVSETKEPQFRLSPTWEASGKYLTLATHPAWLEPGIGADRLRLPAEAKGACMVMQGDFRLLEAIVASLAKSAKPADRNTAAGFARDTRLSGAKWVSWSRMNSDGTTAGVGEITGWPWRDATKATVKRVHDLTANQK
jgi:hypothetical protein